MSYVLLDAFGKPIVKQNPARPTNGYFVYPEVRQFFKLAQAKKDAKRQAKEHGEARIENADTEKVVARVSGRSNPARAVSLKNFTGTITRAKNGQVIVSGRASRTNPAGGSYKIMTEGIDR